MCSQTPGFCNGTCSTYHQQSQYHYQSRQQQDQQNYIQHDRFSASKAPYTFSEREPERAENNHPKGNNNTTIPTREEIRSKFIERWRSAYGDKPLEKEWLDYYVEKMYENYVLMNLEASGGASEGGGGTSGDAHSTERAGSKDELAPYPESYSREYTGPGVGSTADSAYFKRDGPGTRPIPSSTRHQGGNSSARKESRTDFSLYEEVLKGFRHVKISTGQQRGNHEAERYSETTFASFKGDGSRDRPVRERAEPPYMDSIPGARSRQNVHSSKDIPSGYRYVSSSSSSSYEEPRVSVDSRTYVESAIRGEPIIYESS